MTIPGLLMIY